MVAPLPARCGEQLTQGMAEMGLSTSEEERERLMKFLSLMVKWNAAYNLTAIRNPVEMVVKHLLDSIVILPYLTGARLLDVGTGPGLPGIPLAILQPEMEFTLLDANGKKIRFVRQAVLELGLKNIQPVQQRIEKYQPSERFDTITARAFTSLPRLFELTEHLLEEQGRILAMKGAKQMIDRETRGHEGISAETVDIQVPFLNEERHLVIMQRK